MAASFRELTKGEADALYDIWGVRDMQSLENLEKNPKQFWDERVAALTREGATMSHDEFCKQYVQEAKDYIAAFPGAGENDFWFQEEGAIESVIKEFFEESSYNFPDILCAFYAEACDYMHFKAGKCPHVKPAGKSIVSFSPRSQEELLRIPELQDIYHHFIHENIFSKRCQYSFRQPSGEEYAVRANGRGDVSIYIKKAPGANISFDIAEKDTLRQYLSSHQGPGSYGFPETFLGRLRWQCLNGGEFSMFDSLVMQSLGYYLCSADSDPRKRYLFSAHEGMFWGWSGIRRHDVNGHAIHLYELANCRERIGVSESLCFNACCNPYALNSGNLVTMSQQVLSWFHHNHELPAATRNFDFKCRFNLIFPTMQNLSDHSLLNIAPYFMQVPLEHDWRKTPLKKARVGADELHHILLGWRSLYCFQYRNFLTTMEMHSYIDMLDRDVFFTSHYSATSSQIQIDLHRNPKFSEEVLDFLYRQTCAHTSKPLSRVDFEQRARFFTQDIMNVLQHICKQKVTPSVNIFAPAAVHFLLVISDKLKDLTRTRAIDISFYENTHACCVSNLYDIQLYQKDFY